MRPACAAGSGGGARMRERQVHDLEELVFGDGGDPLAFQEPFDGRVLVQVADFGDHAQAYGRGGQAEAGAVAGEGVEEGVAGEVVAFGRGADGSGDGRGHEEEVELGVPGSVTQGVVQAPGPLHFLTDTGVPALVRHGAP